MNKPVLVLFEDKELTKPFQVIDLIKTEVGTSRSKEAYLANMTKHMIISIRESSEDTDISVVNMPNQLKPNESRPIVITFKPSLNRDTGLHADIVFTGEKVMM